MEELDGEAQGRDRNAENIGGVEYEFDRRCLEVNHPQIDGESEQFQAIFEIISRRDLATTEGR
jgi:hypothetical protein